MIQCFTVAGKAGFHNQRVTCVLTTRSTYPSCLAPAACLQSSPLSAGVLQLFIVSEVSNCYRYKFSPFWLAGPCAAAVGGPGRHDARCGLPVRTAQHLW